MELLKKCNKQITLNINKKFTTDNKIIENHFNDAITSIARKLVEKIPTLKLAKTNQNYFSINYFSSEQIANIIRSFQTNKPTAPILCADEYGHVQILRQD